MVINFNKNLQQALDEINCKGYQDFLVSDEERNLDNTDDLLNKYGALKWKLVEILNERYSSILSSNFDLYNWINKNDNDEVAYFLNEAGSNCLNYSMNKIPYKFHLWMGKNNFIIAVEQKVNGFNAEKVNEKMIKDNEGNAFDFFRNCRSEIFFDDKNNTKIIFCLVSL